MENRENCSERMDISLEEKLLCLLLAFLESVTLRFQAPTMKTENNTKIMLVDTLILAH